MPCAIAGGAFPLVLILAQQRVRFPLHALVFGLTIFQQLFKLLAPDVRQRIANSLHAHLNPRIAFPQKTDGVLLNHD